MNEPDLPNKINDLLGDDAEAIDNASRAMLSQLQAYGYRLVITPLAEDISSLLAGDGSGSLSKRTLRLTDPFGGNPIGIRADITAQVSRMDRQHFRTGTTRLCYYGPTIYSRPSKPWLSREQLQIGAELFGDPSASALSEIISLTIKSLECARIDDLTVVVGHTSLTEELLDNLSPTLALETKRALARRDLTTIREMADSLGDSYKPLAALVQMQGDRGQLEDWRKLFPQRDCFTRDFAVLDDFCHVLDQAGQNYTIDLASTGGYEYHSGLVFVVLSGETTVAKGGQYGTSARPATGFTADLRSMLDKLPKPDSPRQFASKRSYSEAGWDEAVAGLLKQGWRCILVDDWQEGSATCTHRLVHFDDRWQLQDWK